MNNSFSLKTLISNKLRLTRERKTFLKGYKEFLEKGTTPSESYQSLISLYCLTNGEFNQRFHEKIKRNNPPKTSLSEKGLLGEMNTLNFSEINDRLNREGYFCFEKKVPASICNELYEYALKTPAIVKGYKDKIVYNPDSPLSEIYRFDMAEIINNKNIQSLIGDPTLIQVARQYLGCEPIFDFPAMWWSTAFSKEASDEAAQLYHFDMDRIKWLKMFFYVNEVTEDNGPHRYIAGTQKPGSKPPDILSRGYVRIKDEELRPYYPEDNFKVLYGEAGSIFAGDTMCWHKGTPLKKGHRLVLEFEYTSSLFGANYPKMVVNNYSNEFKAFCEKNKTYASNILFQ